MILPEIEIVEAHDVLGFDLIDLRAPVAELGQAPRMFDLDTMWQRGRYAPSLFADNDARSLAWLDRAVASGLPEMPPITAPGSVGQSFWHWLASQHSQEEHGIQRRSGQSAEAFTLARRRGEQPGLLYRLPRWAPPGEACVDPAKLYVSDPGLLHQLLGWGTGHWDAQPGRFSTREMALLDARRQASWEGFVVISLVRCAGLAAKASVWRGLDGEIDLILDWTVVRQTWAIEVTMGRNKKLGSLSLGHQHTQAHRAILVYHGKNLPRLKGVGRLSFPVECLTLREALREVQRGP